MSAAFKVKNVLSPLTRCLGRSGRLVTVQSYGRDAGLELIREIWPDENPLKWSWIRESEDHGNVIPHPGAFGGSRRYGHLTIYDGGRQ